MKAAALTRPLMRATHSVSNSAGLIQEQLATGRECLTFRLGAEEYGLDIMKVQEIRGYEEPTRIAGAPADVKGVVDLRGVIVPIIDLRLRFGIERPAYDSNTVTVVLNLADGVVGMVVDSVSDVVDVQASQIRPMPSFEASVDANFITGIATLDAARRMLILVDIDQLMTGSRAAPSAIEALHPSAH
jgi:purine-binding chemotaxis protein CheW